MQYLWIVYWLLMVFSLVIGIFYFFRNLKFRILGLLQSVLTIVIAIGAFIFVLGRDFANENEIEYIINQILNGSLEAVVLVLTYIILIIINVRNIKIMFKK